jgi:pimeloyl-ACP methyl ester carboxylesterase
LKDHRVLLLDQRGTGLSSPVTIETLTDFPDARAQFEYLKNFRADSIVYDSEFIRKELAGGVPWTILGQSYGGFCATTYLSFAPEGLKGAILTGGLPPLLDGPDDVYRATYKRVIEKNQLFYARFPGDAATVRSVRR